MKFANWKKRDFVYLFIKCNFLILSLCLYSFQLVIIISFLYFTFQDQSIRLGGFKY
ncbi:LOW QUALITY PROTEIN: hypothetical protein PanWU01x14_266980 [Parasponia andersonii]|uniref:Uncharacterized protein n=1 Tax=Parasponia andersonii TaxID=3476 RepID=A0A2P5B6N5_PARAD|nr:LOW QUALITY PROTEIN: hypothetical protein PanWU01x14_266980 [Parasponia andersonii]